MWLASDAKNILPPIAAVHNCPIITEAKSGIEVLGKGYHKKCGGRLVAGGVMPEKVGLKQATDCLLGIVDEFEFATPADKSRAIAAILSPALRFGGLLEAHMPLFVVEADASQAGKGFFFELVQGMYSETPSLVTQRQGGVGGFDESLSQALLYGRPIIQLDNMRGHLGSAYFEAILTCPLNTAVSARVPYRGEVQVRPDRFIFQLTSNGFECTRDLANRSCIIRIRKRHEFAFRRYPEGNLLDHIQANQGRHLGAVYSVVAQWLVRGNPSSEDLRGEGRFRKWAQAMDWIIEELFALPPLMDGHEEAQERASNSTLNWLRQVCIAVEADARLEEQLTASDIVDICQSHGIEPPGIPPKEPGSWLLMRVGQIMGKTFKDRDRIEIDAFEIQRTESVLYNEVRRRDETLRKYQITRLRSDALRALRSHKCLGNVNIL